jgi:hypothetical protein
MADKKSPAMKRRMTFLYRDEHATTGRTNLSIGGQRAVYRRAIAF